MSIDTKIHTSIIIPTRNEQAMLSRLVEGLRATAKEFDHPIELIIVDNNSDEIELAQYLKTLLSNLANEPFASIKVLSYKKKFNYSAINNFAVSNSAGTHLCFLNNDIEVINPNWLSELCKPLAQDNIGCVGAMLYYPDDTIQHAGVYLDAKIIAGHAHQYEAKGTTGPNNYLLNDQVVPAVTAACLLMKRNVFDAVNGFDESLAVAFNDVDLCLKVRQSGYQNIWTPAAELYHHESKSRGKGRQRSFMQKLNHKKELALMKHRWKAELKQ